MQCAPAACFPCAKKKRKCDRLLPACSRCSNFRVDEHCWYTDQSRPIGPISRPVVWRQPPKSQISCRLCQSQKRGCNRALPSCMRCGVLSKKCVYEALLVDKLTNKQTCQISTSYLRAEAHIRSLYGPEICPGYPIRDSKYIPGLIHHFCTVSIIPAKAALPDSLARHIQSTWMRSALGDPCLFHATIFAASAHMDGLIGIANNPRTIYHQLQAVKLLRNRLTQPQFQVNYETIGAVLGLGFFDIVMRNMDGVQAHNQGLIQMLTIKHDQGPETEALMGLANMTHFTLSMVSNTDALFLPGSEISGDRSVHPAHPLSGIPPSNLLSRVLVRAAARTNIHAPPIFSPDTVLDLIGIAQVVAQQDAKPLLHEFVSDQTASAIVQTLGAEALRRASYFASFEYHSTISQNINKCVQLAAKVYYKLPLLRAAPTRPSTSPPPKIATITATTTTTIFTSSTVLSHFHDEISLLKATLPKIEFVSWLQHAPEAYVWVCFTAAAASYCGGKARSNGGGNGDWVSFILTPMPVITAMDSATLRLMREGWAYLRWVSGKCDAGIEIGTIG